MYLSPAEEEHLGRLLRVFFSLPYSTDLDGKDAEKLIRMVRGATGPLSKRKETFDIVDGKVGYSVKTLRKKLSATTVDLQEQRFCDKDEMELLLRAGQSVKDQGLLLLDYMRRRISEAMAERGVEDARSAILLKDWNGDRTTFTFRYWEEDFYGFIDDLWTRNQAGEIEWIAQAKGLHGRDQQGVRMLRMHPKHNQIFTDHPIPPDAVVIEFDVQPTTWEKLYDSIYGDEEPIIFTQADLRRKAA
jgi:hypothetical protein